MPAISVPGSQSAVVKDRPGGVATGVVAPPLAAGASESAGPDDDDVAAADAGRLALPGDGGMEVLDGDREAVGQLAVSADRAADVEEDAAAGHQPADGLDAGDRVAEAGDDLARASIRRWTGST